MCICYHSCTCECCLCYYSCTCECDNTHTNDNIYVTNDHIYVTNDHIYVTNDHIYVTNDHICVSACHTHKGVMAHPPDAAGADRRPPRPHAKPPLLPALQLPCAQKGPVLRLYVKEPYMCTKRVLFVCKKSPIQKATCTSSPSAPSRPKRSCVAGVCERGTGSVCAWVWVTLSRAHKHLPCLFLLLVISRSCYGCT